MDLLGIRRCQRRSVSIHHALQLASSRGDGGRVLDVSDLTLGENHLGCRGIGIEETPAQRPDEYEERSRRDDEGVQKGARGTHASSPGARGALPDSADMV